jgi:hypothetical protein
VAARCERALDRPHVTPTTMGNEQPGKYVVKYPPEFNELHLKVDNGLSFFKDELSAAARSGRATNGIKERAQTRKKLKEWEHELNKMEKIKLDAMAEKKKWDERDFERWQEMLDGLKQQCVFDEMRKRQGARVVRSRLARRRALVVVVPIPCCGAGCFAGVVVDEVRARDVLFRLTSRLTCLNFLSAFRRWFCPRGARKCKCRLLECKSLVDGNARTRTAKKEDSRETAEDFLRGDGSNAAQVSRETSGGSLRTGKMSEQEKQAMKEINDKEDVMDDLVDQVSERRDATRRRDAGCG